MSSNFDLAETIDKIRILLDDMGMRLYDVSYNPVSRTLRVFIDRERAGITVEDCRKVSNTITRELNIWDNYDSPVNLEVSSPGVERPLKRIEHYQWASGKVVEIETRDRRLRGYVREARRDGVIIGHASGEDLIPYDLITKAKVVEEIKYGK